MPRRPPDPAGREPAGRTGASHARSRVDAEVRFGPELDALLRPGHRDRPVEVQVAAGTSVKDLVEALGVPHTEIGVVLVDGEPVDLSHRVAGGDRIVVRARPAAVGERPPDRRHPPWAERPTFVLDVHLGKLARDLRLLGFDATWRNDADDADLVDTASREGRILLTRDRGVLKRRAVTRGYLVRATERARQTEEVLRRFDLYDLVDPFGRCLECNGLLEDVAKEVVEDRLPPRTRRDHRQFRRCTGCGRVYWRGSHFDRLRQRVEELRRTDPFPSTGAPRAAALDAWRRGWSVVPLHTVEHGRCSCGDRACPAPGKHPRVAWERFMREVAPEEEVAGWWRRWPRANLGVVTGAISGVVVLDVDPRHGGDETLADLEAIHGPMLPTVESLTGGGGQHLYFSHPGAQVASRPLAPGLDMKGDGGLVVAPPSLHASGRRYVWEAGCSPEEVAPAPFPAWLASREVDAPEPAGRRPTGSGRDAPPRTPEERREFSELWELAGIELQPGDRYYLCPFHPDHRPSLHVDAEGCRFYCFGCGRGGGVGRLRRLLPGHRGHTGPAPASFGPASVPVTLPGHSEGEGGIEVEVVGVSSHQGELLHLTGGRRRYGGVHLGTTARLVPEPDNPFDPGAILVAIGGRTVGYLSRADASRHRDEVLGAIERSGDATCAATIVGGWERGHGDLGAFGVRLRL